VAAAAAAMAAALVLASAASAQEPPASAEADVSMAFMSDRRFADDLTAALRAGDLRTALALLEARPDIAGLAAGVRLRAELLARLERSSEALGLLEGHLTQDSNDAVARFQVAEIHFVARRDSSASLAYRLALAGRLDPLRRQLIQERLAAIDARRRLRLSFSVAMAPDSNINGATSASTIDLYGLPFVLSDDARRRSGVAASLGMSVERRQPLLERYALVAGAAVSLLDAPNRTFDQSQIGLFAGPEMRVGRHGRVALAATYRDIDFGGEDLETWWGLQLTGQGYADAQTRWDGAIRLDRIDNRRAAESSGLAYGAQVNRTRYLGPAELWRASLVFNTHDLAASEAGYREGYLAVGRLFPLPFATLAYVEPYGRMRNFTEHSSAFGVRREDREFGINLRISKRDWTFRNAFPYVQAILSRSSSNVALGRYSRQRIEFGLTREF